MKRRLPLRQRGYVLITVMVATLFFTFLIAAFIGHGATSESDAVDMSLAKIQAYWASAGLLSYAEGRVKAAYSSAMDCNDTTAIASYPAIGCKIVKSAAPAGPSTDGGALNTTIVKLLTHYVLEELRTGTNAYIYYNYANTPTATANELANYSIGVTPEIADVDVPASAPDGIADGVVKVSFTIGNPAANNVPNVLARLVGNAIKWTADVCVGRNGASDPRNSGCNITATASPADKNYLSILTWRREN